MVNATNTGPTSKKPIKITTPPKGRPTPTRNRRRHSGRVFGSTFQWVATAGTLVVVLATAYLAFFA
jgi:hypothetical protein